MWLYSVMISPWSTSSRMLAVGRSTSIFGLGSEMASKNIVCLVDDTIPVC